jgi:hypothetical protein
LEPTKSRPSDVSIYVLLFHRWMNWRCQKFEGMADESVQNDPGRQIEARAVPRRADQLRIQHTLRLGPSRHPRKTRAWQGGSSCQLSRKRCVTRPGTLLESGASQRLHPRCSSNRANAATGEMELKMKMKRMLARHASALRRRSMRRRRSCRASSAVAMSTCTNRVGVCGCI